MSGSSTSFRLSPEARRRLNERAQRENVSATALLERLILEGTDLLDHPGIVYRGPAHERRPGLTGGPDVWEVVSRLRQLPGSEEDRVASLAAETGLHSRQIRQALDFASVHVDDVEERIVRNEEAIRAGRRSARSRRELLG